MKVRVLYLSFILSLFTATNLNAEITSYYKDLKESLEEKGLETELIYTGDVSFNTHGGLKRESSYISSVDLTLTLDTQKAGLWENGTFFVYVLSNHREDAFTDDIVGDLQAVNNIEVQRTTRLFELWYEHLFFDEAFAVLFGLHDMNSEFALSDYGALFINSSFGVSPDISFNSRISTYPLAGPAVRFKYTPNDQWDFMLGVYDGDPGDPDLDEHLPRSIISEDKGILTVFEAAHHTSFKKDDLPGTYKVGFWYNSGDFDHIVNTDLAGDPVKEDGNLGGYVVIDQMVYREKKEEDQGLSLFFHSGLAKRDVSEVDFYVGGGLHYMGLIPGRDEDEAGVALGYASINNDLVNGGGRDSAETVIEATYRASLTPWLAVQPDVQYVINPGTVDARENALVTFLRFEISL